MFIGFFEAVWSTGHNLSAFILQKLRDFQFSFDDCTLQSYDNGAKMLQKNLKALFVPCGAHKPNLVIADVAESSEDAIRFLGGILQKLYSMF